MQKTYGIVWRDGAAPLAAGRLELLPGSLRLEGEDATREIGYDQLAAVRVARTRGERLDGRPSIVLERHHGAPVTIAAVTQSSVVGEIAGRLTELQVGAQPRPMQNGGVSYLPTPGPGDSDGGDIF